MDLLTALKSGDENAFESIFLSNKEKVLAYFYKKTNSLADAEDLLQNTFLKLWKYRHTLNEAFLLDQHLFHIARTVYIDFVRSKNTRRGLSLIKDYGAGSLTREESPDLDRRHLEEILTKMPALRRQVFILHKLEGYSYKEIADLLSINVKKVDNHLSRALKQIRKNFLQFFSF